jgi:enterochelin esterase-like enzyme
MIQEGDTMPSWSSFETFLAEAAKAEEGERQALVDELLHEHPDWPWVDGNHATFIYVGMGAQQVALNLDTIKTDPPFAPMTQLEGTTLWHVTREFASDDLLDYMVAVDDPMTPIATEPDIVQRISQHWRVDDMNPIRMTTSHLNVSVLRMHNARPFLNWKGLGAVSRGTIYEHAINSVQLHFTGRKMWVYTPPGYAADGDEAYPLLIFQDGQWAVGPMQMSYIVDMLIKYGKMQPAIIAMVQSGNQKERIKTFVSNDKHYLFMLMELLPFLQMEYRIDPGKLGLGGVSAGAIAAAHAVLKNPAAFSRLLMISPPLGKGVAQNELLEYARRFEQAATLPRRIFQSVGRYETRSRFLLPARLLNRTLRQREDIEYQYTETGSGHGLVGFRSILPEALAWCFPGENS